MFPIRNTSFLTIALLALAGLFLTACVSAPYCELCEDEDEGEIVALASLSPAVQATILQYADGRPLDEIEHEFENGVEMYCVELDTEEETEFHVAPDGAFLGFDDDDDDDDEDHDDDDRD